MEIYLVRHGIAEDGATSDFERRLTEEGAQKAQAVARVFRKRVNGVEAIFHSPLYRAQETAEIFGREFHLEPQEMLGLKPTDHPELALQEIRNTKLDQILIVGHEPNLSQLAMLLIDGRSKAIFTFKKAGIAGIEWNGRVGELLFLLTPKFLI